MQPEPPYQTIIDLTTANEFHSWQIFDGAGRVRASASDHPGSTSGSTGQYVIYNSMGRVVEQSNPTEINSSWAPGGDDAAAGWRVILQSYDWKGRPNRRPTATARRESSITVAVAAPAAKS